MFKLLIVGLLCFYSPTLSSQIFFYQNQLPNNERNNEDYVKDVFALADTNGALNNVDIKSIEYQKRFQPKKSIQLFNADVKAYWLKFKFKKQVDASLIVSFDPAYSLVEYYNPSPNGKYLKMIGGFSVPRNKSQAESIPNIAFKIGKSDDKTWHYFRIIPPNETFGFGYEIFDSAALIGVLPSSYLRMGVFFGLILFAIVFNLILFAQLRQFSYLYYTLYILMFALYVAAEWRLFSIFQFGNYRFSFIVYSLPFVGMTVFLLLYIYSFFPPDSKFRAVRQISIAMVVIRVFLYLVAHVYSANTFLFSMVVDMLCILFPFILIVHSSKEYQPARYLSIAIGLIFLGYAAHFELISFNAFIQKTFTIQNLGIIELLLLSVALGNRIKTTEKEREVTQQQLVLELKEKQVFKDRLNVELEQKVEQRTQEINRMNQLLKDHNLHLEAEVENLVTARVMQEGVSLVEFKKIFPDEDACFAFLSDLKWRDGFACKFCNSSRFTFVNSPHNYSRRCSECKKIESPTANTIFHKLKFPVEKAFYILFLVNSGQKMTYDQLSEQVDLRVATCFAFKKKVIEAMEHKKVKKNQKVVWSDWILP